MARLGLSYRDVEEAASSLLECNTDLDPNKITIEKVREILKRGSNTTIARHLKKWRTEVNNAQSWLTERLDNETAMLNGIYDNLKRQANAEAEKMKEEALQSVQKAQAELADFKIECERLKNELEKVQGHLDEANSDIKNFKIKNTKLEDEKSVLVDQLSEKRDEIKRLESFNINLDANLTKFHETSEQQRLALELKIENERMSHKDERDQLFASMMENKAELAVWKTSAEKECALATSLTERNAKLEEKINNYANEIVNKNSEIITLRKDIESLRKDFLEIEVKAQANVKVIDELQNQCRITNQTNESLQTQLKNAHAAVDKLTKDNFELGIEKAKLIGQNMRAPSAAEMG